MVTNSVLFGAGRGKRLRPLTDRVPKPALPVLDIPLAGWSVSALTEAVAPVVVNGSHLAEDLMRSLSELRIDRWSPFLEEPEAFGTAGTLRALRDSIGRTVVTWNGDVVTDLRPVELLTAHTQTDHPATLVVRRVDRAADLEVEDGAVSRFIDRRREDAAGAQFLGIAAFDRDALDDLPDARPAGLGETLLRTLGDRGQLAVFEFSRYWRDVGTPHAYLHASLDVLNGRAPQPPTAFPGAVTEVAGGVAYTGPDAEVDAGSLGPGAIVLSGATVEPGAVVTNSVVFPGSRVPAGAIVEDTVWFEDRRLGGPSFDAVEG